MDLKSSFTKSLSIAAMTFSMATAAHAAALRTFVSGFGDDKNTSANCAHAAPCRTFAVAVTVTSPGGEIEALDPAGYGPITISGPLTLIGLPGAAINAPANGYGITINAGPNDVVRVQGLLIDGGGVGFNGIVFNSGGSLTVDNCVIQNFFFTVPNSTGIGILIQPSSGSIKFAITNTTMANNGGQGFFYLPLSGSTAAANGVLDRVTATDNRSTGIAFNTALATAPKTIVSITNSTASGSNVGSGIVLSSAASAPLTASIDNTATNNNAQDGIAVSGVTLATLSRSIVTGNGNLGVANTTSTNTFYTFGNNQIALNNTDNTSVLNNAVYSLH